MTPNEVRNAIIAKCRNYTKQLRSAVENNENPEIEGFDLSPRVEYFLQRIQSLTLDTALLKELNSVNDAFHDFKMYALSQEQV